MQIPMAYKVHFCLHCTNLIVGIYTSGNHAPSVNSKIAYSVQIPTAQLVPLPNPNETHC